MVAIFCSICRFFSLSSSFWFSSSDKRLLRAGSTLHLSNSSPLTSSTWKTDIAQVNLDTEPVPVLTSGWLLWLPCPLMWSFCSPSFSGVQLQRWTHAASCPDLNSETRRKCKSTRSTCSTHSTQYARYTQYIQYIVYSIHSIQYTVNTVHNIHSTYSTQHIVVHEEQGVTLKVQP